MIESQKRRGDVLTETRHVGLETSAASSENGRGHIPPAISTNDPESSEGKVESIANLAELLLFRRREMAGS